jgi:hypothetical protein
MPKQRCINSGKSRSAWCAPCQSQLDAAYKHRTKCEGLRAQVQSSQDAASEACGQTCAVCSLPTQEVASCHEEQCGYIICSACMPSFLANQTATRQPRVGYIDGCTIPVLEARVQSFLVQNTTPSDVDLRSGKRERMSRKGSRERSSTSMSSASFMEVQGYTLRNYREVDRPKSSKREMKTG